MSGRPLSAEIHLAALAANWREIKRRAPRRAFAVIKADAYGHGLLRVASFLNRQMDAADGFALTELADALALRKRGVRRPILLLNGFFDEKEAAAAARYDVWFALHSPWQVAALSHLPSDAKATAFIKCDTGMNRLGFSPADALAVAAQLRAAPRKKIKTICAMTHFAAGDYPASTRAQLRRFAPLRAAGLPLSMANSALLFFHPQADDDWARIGIALYGASPAADRKKARDLRLCPAMTLKSRLIAIRHLRRGEKVGYGGEFTAKRATRIGVAVGGYGDGYPRAAWRGGAFFALVKTSRGEYAAPLAGRVSMDLLALDISDLPAGIGDEVVLWGDSPGVDELAAAAGTIGYEILAGASARIRRVYR